MGRFTVKKPMIKEKQTTVAGRRNEKLKESTSCGKRIWIRRTVMAAIFFILILGQSFFVWGEHMSVLPG